MKAEEKFGLLMKTVGRTMSSVDSSLAALSDIKAVMHSIEDEAAYAKDLVEELYADMPDKRRDYICGHLKQAYDAIFELKLKLGSMVAYEYLDAAMDRIREFAWRAKDETK